MAFSAIPHLGGPALELFNAVIAPPVDGDSPERLAERGSAERLPETPRTRGVSEKEDLVKDEEFISAATQATTAAVRNRRQEKIEALRNAVLKTALRRIAGKTRSGRCSLAFVDQFTVWHLRVFKELSNSGPPMGQTKARIRCNC